MGDYKVYCHISKISISEGDECLILPIKKRTSIVGYSEWIPATLPIFGKYNGIGELCDIVKDDTTNVIESHFRMPIEDFCSRFTQFDDNDGWSFCFILKEVYDFCKLFNVDKALLDLDLEHPRLRNWREFDDACGMEDLFFKDRNAATNFMCPNQSELEEMALTDNEESYEEMCVRISKIMSETDPLCNENSIQYKYNEYVDFLKKELDVFGLLWSKSHFCDNPLHLENAERDIAYNYYGINRKLFLDSVCDLMCVSDYIRTSSLYFTPYIKFVTPNDNLDKEHLKLLKKFSDILKERIS